MKTTQERVDSILNKVALRQSAEQERGQKNDVMTTRPIKVVKRPAAWAIALSSAAVVIVIFGVLYLIRSTSVFDSATLFSPKVDVMAPDAYELMPDEMEQAESSSELLRMIDESTAFDDDVTPAKADERVDPKFIAGLTLELRSKGLSLAQQAEEDVASHRETDCEGLLFIDREDADRRVCVVFSSSATGSYERELSPLSAPKGLDVGYWQTEQGQNYLIESTGDTFFQLSVNGFSEDEIQSLIALVDELIQ